MNRIVTTWAAASLLIAITATTGKTSDIGAAASKPAVLDAAATISESVLWSFGANEEDGIEPVANLIADQWGNLYGTTFNDSGTAFKLRPPSRGQTQWSEQVLWHFGGSGDGDFPGAGLIADRWGNLYGTTEAGGASGRGTVFEVSPPSGKSTQWSERVLWSFGGSGDGIEPEASLVADQWGNLYGTTLLGGANENGIVFELSPASGKSTQWSERVLWSFGGTNDGQNPRANLIADRRGNLYSTTELGGANERGTVFEVSPPSRGQTQWSERVLWSFGGSGDGLGPTAGLIADQWGNLYGTTSGGGANESGIVFELSSPSRGQTQWSEQVLWSFGGSGDGENPLAGLIADNWDNLYGTTAEGGANSSCGPLITSCGTVFELSPPSRGQTQWSEQVLWSFGGSGDGQNPAAGLLADNWGNLYGTTQYGGTNVSCPGLRGRGVGCGTAFELNLH